MNVNKNINILSLNIWLITMIILLTLIVIVGGLTRLTESGLSITAWEVFKGVLPPLNLQQWNYYFSEYKKIPEYKLLNSGMSLQEFKVIFYWEYSHRLLAKIIGLSPL
jgi:cytochrome c oxidase assembly protein subunit 15